jgi:hypothetical protein
MFQKRQSIVLHSKTVFKKFFLFLKANDKHENNNEQNKVDEMEEKREKKHFYWYTKKKNQSNFEILVSRKESS